MNIVLFLNKDLEASIAYNLLKPELLHHHVRIYYSNTVGNSSSKPSELVQLEYFEKGFLCNELATFINEHEINTSFEFFDDHFKSFPIKKCTQVNSPEFIHEIKEFQPDVFISIRFGKIFKDEIIQIPKNGVLNLHSAILPDYRGIMGTLHAIKAKDKKIGCTLHTIPNSGIDTGEIIEIAELDPNYQKSLFWNIVQLYPLGAALIIKALKKMELNSSIKTKKQDLTKGNYFSVPTKHDFEHIKSLGMEVISIKEYQDVLTRFVLKNLSEIEEKGLTRCIKNSLSRT